MNQKSPFICKSEAEKDAFRKVGKISQGVLEKVCQKAEPGVSTWDLDLYAEELIRAQGYIPTFKNYLGFPCTICVAVNQEVVHGIPNKKKILKEGDIFSIDVGVTLTEKIEGKPVKFIGDNARTIPIGEISPKAQKLIADTIEGLQAGIEKCKPGNLISDIAKAVEEVGLRNRYGIVEEFGGHGVGPEYHCEPFIPNFSGYFDYYPDSKIQEGMVLAIEPMFTLGNKQIKKLKDNWTVVTKDSKLASHYEHSVLVTKEGPEIITVLEK